MLNGNNNKSNNNNKKNTNAFKGKCVEINGHIFFFKPIQVDICVTMK